MSPDSCRKIELPYGKGSLTISVPVENLLAVVEPRRLPPAPDLMAELRRVLANPVGAPRLREKARGARSVAVVVEDVSRPVPSSLLLDAVMEELEAAGVTTDKIKVIVATGLHRDLTRKEMDRILGRWKGKLHIENHNAKDPDRLVPLGTTRLGTEIAVNKTFMQAEFKILTGDVEYHQFCGYGGGAKCVYPGMASADAIRMNHSRMDLPGTGPGRIAGNPVREEINEVGRMARVDYNLSVALDAEHRIVAARAGDPDLSFREACRFIDEMYLVEIPGRADLVIASPGGHPKDLDLYQSQKAIEEASLDVKPGGSVLVAARCEEGSGSKTFERWMDEAYDPEEIVRRIKEKFIMGGHKAYQIAREVQRARVYLYSELPPGRVRAWMMHPIRSMEEIDALIAQADSVLVLPQATLTLTRLPNE
ncbi:MAG: nickel-dependent lactate racemase [Planctomycetota bacterium]